MKKAISIIFLLCILSFIFFMSSQNAIKSNNYNVEIVKLLRNKGWIDLYSLYDNNSVDIIIRKLAHFSEFALLSIAAFLVFRAFKIKRVTILTSIFCISLAVADELHQLYVWGRTSSVIDVLIDSTGIMMTVCLISLTRIIRYELANQDESHFLKKGRNL